MGDQLTARINFRVQEEDYRVINQAAASEGLLIGQFARRAALLEARRSLTSSPPAIGAEGQAQQNVTHCTTVGKSSTTEYDWEAA